ncbi:MAG: pectate lyase [Muribaculaceae bacterium]|nr:pectate lyase [Muribaculaceae bacterium]
MNYKVKVVCRVICLALAIFLPSSAVGQESGYHKIDKRTAKKILREEDPAFFKSEESVRIGDQLLLWQRATGGWPKNEDMVSPMSDELKSKVAADKYRQDDSTTDNDATTLQMTYLARLYKATGHQRFRKAFQAGLEYLLSGQYENGGWPQFWPVMHDYQTHITYNDDAMVSTMTLLRDVALGKSPFDSDLCDEDMKERLIESFNKGVECILATQIVVDGEPTVWCQQHDRVSLLPAKARSYELPSYCSQESAAIVKLLMEIPNPDERIVKAIDGAMKWFGENRIKYVRHKRENIEGKWIVSLEENPEDDTPVWARYYDLEDCQPFVCDRDGIPRRHLEEIGEERRTGYSWYNDRPSYLFPIYEEWKSNLK